MLVTSCIVGLDINWDTVLSHAPHVVAILILHLSVIINYILYIVEHRLSGTQLSGHFDYPEFSSWSPCFHG